MKAFFKIIIYPFDLILYIIFDLPVRGLKAFARWYMVKTYILEAKLNHKADNKRYYVLETAEGIKVLNNLQIKRHNQNTAPEKRIDIKTLLEEAIYITK